MKTIIFYLALVFVLSTSAQNKITLPPKASKIGMIGELVYVKGVAESEARRAMLCPEKNQGFLKKYNALKVLTDQIYMQLISDMQMKNSVRKFTLLNQFFSNQDLIC